MKIKSIFKVLIIGSMVLMLGSCVKTGNGSTNSTTNSKPIITTTTKPTTESTSTTTNSVIEKFNVYFIVDSKIEKTTTIDKGQLIENYTPVKEGYTFVNWYNDSSFTSLFDINTPVNNDIALYAKFEVNKYTVEFKNVNIPNQTIEHGKNIIVSDPIKEGFVFAGWYTDGSYTTPFNTTTQMTSNLELYAKFEEQADNTPINSYTITFENALVDEQTIIEGQTVTKPIDPIKEGHSFKGWYTDSNYTNEYDFTTQVTSSFALYAKFDINTFIVTFEETDIQDQNVNYNSPVTKPTDPTREGYSFAGWYTDSSYTNEYDFTSLVTTNITLYAKFDICKYTITFNVEDIPQQTINYNETVTKPNDPTKENHTFEGWYTDSNYTNEYDFTAQVTSSFTLYAKFKEITKYSVTFMVDGEEYHQTMVNANTTVDEPKTPTKEEYEFKGWFKDSQYTDEFLFTSKINEKTTLYAKFEKINLDELNINITSQSGYNEGAYVEFDVVPSLINSSNYTISYKKYGTSTYTEVDSELIRINDTTVRCDILGLASGSYTIKIECSLSSKELVKESNTLTVSNYDRSGYAHFNYTEGVGAYNNDGTVKDNAVIVYVNEENKNTVTATLNGKSYTGLGEILINQKYSSKPLIIRIIGTVGAATWNEKTYSGNALLSTSVTGLNGKVLTQADMDEEAIIEGGYNTLNTSKYSKLNKLTNKIKYSERTYKKDKVTIDKYEQFDSYYNMLDVKDAKNVTVEGVGPNAQIFQWGFTWKTCNSIEVRNLTFSDYTEDACSFEGSSSAITNYGNYWVHNNTFNSGKNYWDVCYEQDKPMGDGATDFKYCEGITSSYNTFYKCKKTGLVGGGDSNLTKDVTFHHNYYNQVGSRLPLGRQANMHIYNNYYYNCGTAQDIRANAFVLSESNYFEGCTNPQKVTTSEAYAGAAIKSYNDYLTSCGKSAATVVTSRTTAVSNQCKPDGKTDYSNFDTDATKFYYDSTNKKSDVKVMTEVSQVPEFVKANAGAMTGSFVGSDKNEDTKPEDNATWTTKLNQDFSSSMTISQSTSTPTSAGLYYTSEDTANNYVEIASGQLKIIDTSTTTTYGYYIFDETYNSGKVRVSIDFIPETQNTKWTMIHFLDGNTNIGVRSDTSKYLNYTIDNGTTTTPITTSAYSVNTTYTIALTLDFDSNEAKISINGTEVTISNYNLNSIYGIMLQTAGTSERSFAVDNLKVEIA